MCCQEMGEKEATVALFCPKAAYDEPKVRKVKRMLWALVFKSINRPINMELIKWLN